LTVSHWEDGANRLPGSLILFVEDGVVKVCVNDRDSGSVAFATVPSLADVLYEVASLLASPTLEWRASKGKSRKPRT
jgi:hypothetical protein